MKKLTLLFIAVLLGTYAFAQDDDVPTKKRAPKNTRIENKRAANCPFAYINLGTGLNNNNGLIGVGVNLAVAQQASIDMGLGIGSWGYKFYAGAKYYLNPCQVGWAFGGGVTYATGLSDFHQNMETIYGVTEPVVVDLHAKTNFFIAAYKYWSIGKRYNRIYLELGWSLAVTPTQIRQTEGDRISDNSVKTLNAISPGGLIVGAGLSFGMPRSK